MKRTITGFRLDDEGDWTAVLDCCHPQHVRHNPPLSDRPWVTTEEGRQSMIGATLDCLRCDELEFPEDIEPYTRTSIFNETTVPGALQKAHKVSRGIWAKIHVIEGHLTYVIHEPVNRTFTLDPSQEGIILPEIEHRVEILDAVKFYVEFYKL